MQHFVKDGVPLRADCSDVTRWRIASSTSPRLRGRGRKRGCRYARRARWQHFVKDGVPYSIGKPRGLGPRGKALSSVAISASLSVKSPAAALSAACSALDAFGIASTEAARVRNASATWRAARLVRVGDGLQHLAALAARGRKIIMSERRIGDDGDTVLLAPRDDRVLDRALLQMVEHLVAGDLALARDIEQFVEIVRCRNC